MLSSPVFGLSPPLRSGAEFSAVLCRLPFGVGAVSRGRGRFFRRCGTFFGHRTFWAIVTAYVSVALLYRFFSRNFKTVLAIYTVSHLVTDSVYYLLYSFSKTEISFFGELWSDFLPSFALSLPVLALLYLIYGRVYYKNPDVRLYGKAGFRR